ncbi:MAG TPA: ATP-binding cassette domain-containing protein [Trebonia sp.]|nr:ATP-binding cassette domain-containing protein [Trebonia sp.]
MSEPALQVADVAKSYGALSVFRSVSFAIAEGEALGIVGPNGAGKTTLLDLLTGTGRCDAGRVLLHGKDVTRLPPPLRARMGLGRTFQVPRPFGDLTVFENALVGAMRAAGLRGSAAYDAAGAALSMAGIARQANAPAGSLRLLDRKRLELARALAMRPRVLLLDEIAGGLSDPETEALIATIRAVSSAGTAIVWVEHVLRVLTAVVPRLMCLAGGQVIADGVPSDVLASDAVRTAFLGGGVL